MPAPSLLQLLLRLRDMAFSAVWAYKARSIFVILGVGFGVAVTIGGTIGTGILRRPGTIAQELGQPSLALLVWVLVGAGIRLLRRLTFGTICTRFIVFATPGRIEVFPRVTSPDSTSRSRSQDNEFEFAATPGGSSAGRPMENRTSCHTWRIVAAGK